MEVDLSGLLSKKSGRSSTPRHHEPRSEGDDAVKLRLISVRKDEYASRANYDSRRRNVGKKTPRRGGRAGGHPIEGEHLQHSSPRTNSGTESGAGQWGSAVLWVILAVVLFVLAISLCTVGLLYSKQGRKAIESREKLFVSPWSRTIFPLRILFTKRLKSA